MVIITEADFTGRLKHLCGRNRLSGLPRKYKDKLIIVACIAQSIDPERDYDEQGINAEIRRWLAEFTEPESEDYIAPRRMLVDEGFMEREADGSRYRMLPGGPGWQAFEPGIRALDISTVVYAAREEYAARRSPVAGG